MIAPGIVLAGDDVCTICGACIDILKVRCVPTFSINGSGRLLRCRMRPLSSNSPLFWLRLPQVGDSLLCDIPVKSIRPVLTAFSNKIRVSPSLNPRRLTAVHAGLICAGLDLPLVPICAA